MTKKIKELEALRDRFFELHAARGHDSAFLERVDAITEPPSARVDGLSVSWHPTATHKALRFLSPDRLEEEFAARCARPAAPALCAVFVDPRELSFRTFENIVPLDAHFDKSQIELTKKKDLGPIAWSFRALTSEGTRAALQELDELGLYVPPLNACSRGGERFIFHSAELASALTAAVKKALPKAALKGFSHVTFAAIDSSRATTSSTVTTTRPTSTPRAVTCRSTRCCSM